MAAYDMRKLFMRTKTGLQRKFSFILIGCHTKFKENILPFYFTIAMLRIDSYLSKDQ